VSGLRHSGAIQIPPFPGRNGDSSLLRAARTLSFPSSPCPGRVSLNINPSFGVSMRCLPSCLPFPVVALRRPFFFFPYQVFYCSMGLFAACAIVSFWTVSVFRGKTFSLLPPPPPFSRYEVDGVSWSKGDDLSGTRRMRRPLSRVKIMFFFCIWRKRCFNVPQTRDVLLFRRNPSGR